MTDRTSRAVAPVSAICAAFRTQPSAYPPEAPKPDVAPTCGSVRQSCNAEAGASAGGFRRRAKPQAAEAGEKAWRFSAPAHPLLPAVRAVLGDKNGAFLRE